MTFALLWSVVAVGLGVEVWRRSRMAPPLRKGRCFLAATGQSVTVRMPSAGVE